MLHAHPPRQSDCAGSLAAVGLLSRLERAELHLDVVGLLEGQLLLLRLVGNDTPHRRELDNDPLITLDQRVDDQLVGSRFELEVLERVDVEADRQRREEG